MRSKYSSTFCSYALHAGIVGLREAGITWLNVLEKGKSAPYIRNVFKFKVFDAYIAQSFRSYDLDSLNDFLIKKAPLNAIQQVNLTESRLVD